MEQIYQPIFAKKPDALRLALLSPPGGSFIREVQARFEAPKG
jgi:hypothetical protein